MINEFTLTERETGLISHSSEEVYVWFIPVDILFLRKVCCYDRKQNYTYNILFTALDYVSFLHAHLYVCM